MKKEVILVLIVLVLIISCSKLIEKTITQEHINLPDKEKELSRGLDINAPELQSYVEELKKEESVWFKKISTPEIKLTIQKGNQFSPEQSKKVCDNTCNACSQRLGKNLVGAKLQQEKIKEDSCTCSFDKEVNGGEYYSCLDEANRAIYSELFDGLIKKDPSLFPKLNQMYFMFSSYDKEKVNNNFCDNICGYCATKFGQKLDFTSAPTINEEGDLQCTCQTTDFSVNYYRVNSCVADLISIIPSK
ncbi:hypothetical protein HZA97_06600 [Candidatus Woesearchaeota archaeon]|nr:hypothetical protein [Candidatus Woesearchaeota archaeon]